MALELGGDAAEPWSIDSICRSMSGTGAIDRGAGAGGGDVCLLGVSRKRCVAQAGGEGKQDAEKCFIIIMVNSRGGVGPTAHQVLSR